MPASDVALGDREVIVEPPDESLADMDLGIEVVEGFSRPNWKAVRAFVKSQVLPEDRSEAWNYIVFRWLKELASDWGGSCRLFSSKRFFCLSDLDPATTRVLLDYAESTVAAIRSGLGKAAWSGFHGKHVLLFFADRDDYFAYISYYHADGTHMLSGGIFTRRGYAHIALPYGSTLTAQHVLAHELAHNLLCHLPIPLWLNEGLAVTIERQMTRSPFSLDGDLADRHRNHWNKENIQSFWSGQSYDEPGDGSELSYSLGEILVALLAERGSAFAEFVRDADWRDGGQDAAVNLLGRGLEEVLTGFLGPGEWRPQRKAIRELLQRRSA